jgi:hypothetical protein
LYEIEQIEESEKFKLYNQAFLIYYNFLKNICGKNEEEKILLVNNANDYLKKFTEKLPIFKDDIPTKKLLKFFEI